MQAAPLGVPGDASRDDGGALSSRVVLAVQVPDGVPQGRAHVTFEPKTADEFDAIVEACGGPGTFTALPGFAFGEIAGGQAHVLSPTDRPVSERHVFMEAFDERVKSAKGQVKSCPIPDAPDDVPW